VSFLQLQHDSFLLRPHPRKVKALKDNKIQRLELSGKFLGIGGAVLIAGLMKSSRNLHFLDLSHNQIGPEAVAIIGSYFIKDKSHCPSTLNISYNWLGAEGTKRIAEILSQVPPPPPPSPLPPATFQNSRNVCQNRRL
jgi:Ran GTPase-activating protein (RanGAP) involved in mRNA processing and transport